MTMYSKEAFKALEIARNKPRNYDLDSTLKIIEDELKEVCKNYKYQDYSRRDEDFDRKLVVNNYIDYLEKKVGFNLDNIRLYYKEYMEYEDIFDIGITLGKNNDKTYDHISNIYICMLDILDSMLRRESVCGCCCPEVCQYFI